MQATVELSGTEPVLHEAAVWKFPLVVGSHSSVHCNPNGDQPCFPLVVPRATTAAFTLLVVGGGSTNDPEIVPVPSAVTVLSSGPATVPRCRPTLSFAA